jgi:protein-S-isoprenylcysteine O-methyltransferase Ste14
MNSGRLALLVIGVILLLMGIVFALQGANVITGSSLMSGNSTYIYVGTVVAIIGLVLLAWASRSKAPPAPSMKSTSPQAAAP